MVENDLPRKETAPETAMQMKAMKYMAGIIISMFTVAAQAQYTITLTITELPPAPATDLVYLAGNFNNWNPQDENFRLQKDLSGHFFTTVKKLAAGPYEFKFTRGGWDRAETDRQGNDLPNRSITVQSDTSIQFSVAGWKDGFKQKQKPSTASAQVTVIDTAFMMPQLKRTRRIWIYLPKHYAVNSQKRYPVLYMHDGQNLFDNSTSFAGEWGIDEALDTTKNACIVIGIDNGGSKRMTEYNPNDSKQYGKGEGRAYLDFIVHTLKPFIDKNYRSLPGKQQTWMAGSSMGGLISFYAGLYYPRVFGRLGIFSPSFWIAPQIKVQVKQLAKKTAHGSQKYYFYAGAAEGAGMAADMETVAAELKKIVNPQMMITVNPQGRHNEPTWSAAFPAFYAWIARD